VPLFSQRHTRASWGTESATQVLRSNAEKLDRFARRKFLDMYGDRQRLFDLSEMIGMPILKFPGQTEMAL
jgi:hypothetical protein